MKNKCEAGCIKYTGGEIRHDKNCYYYPESFTKLYDDLKETNKELIKVIEDKIDSLNSILKELELNYEEKFTLVSKDRINSDLVFLNKLLNLAKLKK